MLCTEKRILCTYTHSLILVLTFYCLFVQLKTANSYLVVYSITSLQSYEEADFILNSIVKKHKPIGSNLANIPVILVANKSDCEEDRQVSQQQMKDLALKYGGIKSYEMSVKEEVGKVEQVMDEIAIITMQTQVYKVRGGKDNKWTNTGANERSGANKKCTLM